MRQQTLALSTSCVWWSVLLLWKQSTCTEFRILKELCRWRSVGVNCEERCSTGMWLSASTCSGCLPCRDLLSLKCPVPGSGPSCLSCGAVGWSCQEDCIRPVSRLLARDFPCREGQTEEFQRCKQCYRMVSLGVRGRGFPPEWGTRPSQQGRQVGWASLWNFMWLQFCPRKVGQRRSCA